jgi:hypothetical protein
MALGKIPSFIQPFSYQAIQGGENININKTQKLSSENPLGRGKT